MRYLGNDRNIVRNATLSASNIVPSAAIFRSDTTPKVGGGRVNLAGPYEGQADATIDVEILDSVGDSSQVSQPVFTGIGNGTLTALSANDVDAQAFTVTVEDLGTQTRSAYAPFQGVNLVARASGAGGNAITVSVSHAALVLGDTDFSLQGDIVEGSNEYAGEQWNFGAATLTADGKIPADAPRIVFGEDPQVYRAWRRYKDGRYVYGFSPAPVRDAAKGSRVHSVSGSRTITISNGVTTETISGVVTLYDALSKIRDQSTLIVPDAAIVNDTLPGGQGAVDLSVWTASYVIGVDTSGSDAIKHAELTVTAATTAPTETLEVRCVSAASTGAEKWEVRGDASLRLADAITNALYSSGPYSFTIPLPEVVDSTPGNTTGNIGFEYEPVAADGRQYPNVGIFRPALGAAARNGVFEFVYARRPKEDCTQVGEVRGGPREECLGINPPEDTIVSDASRIIRLQRLTAAVRTHVDANTGATGEVSVTDVTAIKKGASILRDVLTRMQAGTLANPEWEASTAYATDDVREPTAANGYRYAVTTAGTSGASEPGSWTTTIGGTVSDGSVVWTNIGKSPYGMWDAMFATWSNEVAMLTSPRAINAEEWSSNNAAVVGDYLVTTTRNGLVYFAESSVDDTGAATQNATHGEFQLQLTHTDLGGTPFNRGIVVTRSGGTLLTTWAVAYRYWMARQNLAVGAVAQPGNGRVYRVTTAGIAGTTEPTWPTTSGGTVSDGTAVWTEVASYDLAAAPDDTFFERYRAAGNDVLAAAGIDPSFNFASTEGDGCWQDSEDAFYWQSEDGYMPVFNNLYYHSSRQYFDEDGEPYIQSTQEFGFAIRVGCPEMLREGDIFRLMITDVQGSSTGRGYQEGDTFFVRAQNAVPVPFGGGQTGDDTITFSVRGSVDGRLADYPLITTALAPYSATAPAWAAITAYAAGVQRRPTTRNGFRYTASAGTSGATEPTWPTTLDATVVDGTVTWTCTLADIDLGFAITPGGIDFALGDRFTFNVEGGHFRWRKNGGAWSASKDIGTLLLESSPGAGDDEGISLTFTGGVAPSWVTGDTWSFTAEATSGAEQLRQPTDARCAWTGSTVIDVTPIAPSAITGVMIGGHSIPSDAVIRLQGSDDNFATTPVNEVVPWASDCIWHAHAGTRARWRVTVDKGGSCNWIWLGTAMQPKILGGPAESGTLSRRVRLPGVGRRLGFGGQVEHSALTKDAVDDVLEMLAHACTYDDRRFGFEVGGQAGIVAYQDESLEVADLFGFQPTDTGRWLQTVRLELEPIP